MRIEEEHPSVLQNLEFLVVQFYRQHHELTDYSVQRVYEALTDRYAAERLGRPPRALTLSAQEGELLAELLPMAEYWLGRQDLEIEGADGVSKPPAPIAVETLILCLKRLLKSVQKWTREYGRQGYLEYIVRFIK